MGNKAKQKGNSFEYDCQDSLEQAWSDVYRTCERGFQLQYDLQIDSNKTIYECKRWKAIGWNQLVKFYRKMRSKAPSGYTPYLLFKSNFQPCLVFYHDGESFVIKRFDIVFKVPFMKHKPTR